tara:strand:+ start:3574 stop:4194 length:621 start_codon:yes stop_codon:yes gene_type:complete
MNLDTITIGDKNSADITLFWFHGYGANNWGFEPFIKLLNLNLDGRLYVVMPNAPMSDGKRSWYPLPSTLNGTVVEDDEGIENSKKNIRESLQSYTNHDRKLYLGGFSQGAALALSMGLNDDIKNDGVIAISGYIPSASTINITDVNKDIYIAHGQKDTTITIETHKRSIDFLEDNKLSYTEYVDDCGHTISKDMINNLTEWMYKIL